MIHVLMVPGLWYDPLDLAIMALTQSKYSHCGFVLDGTLVVEVNRKGRRAILLKDYPYKYDLFEVNLPEDKQHLLHTWVSAKAKEPTHVYDYLAIAGIILRSLTGFKLTLNSPNAETCSEFDGTGGAAAGFRWSKGLSLLTPQDMLTERFAVRP